MGKFFNRYKSINALTWNKNAFKNTTAYRELGGGQT
jgi:hypothetical protein